MIILYLFGIGVIIGIVKYIWLLFTLSRERKTTFPAVETINNKDNDYYTILDEITHLECIIDRLNDLEVIYRSELETCYNDKRKAVLLSKLNTIDQQTFKHRKRIIILKKKLE